MRSVFLFVCFVFGNSVIYQLYYLLNRDFTLILRKRSQHPDQEESSWGPFLYQGIRINKNSLKMYKSFSNLFLEHFWNIFFGNTLDRVLNKLWNAIRIFLNPQSNKNIYCPQGSTNHKTIWTACRDHVTKIRNMTAFSETPSIVKAKNT